MRTGVTLAVPALVAVLGFYATYLYNLTLARRKDRLDRINRQLSDLYGPLLALSTASNESWRAFRQRYRPGGGAFWSNDPSPTAQEGDAWRLWMTEVFMPSNVAMADVITQNAELLDELDMPRVLLQVCAHVTAYRAVIRRWEGGDFAENKSVINFPGPALSQFARDGFQRLKAQQSDLLRARH